MKSNSILKYYDYMVTLLVVLFLLFSEGKTDSIQKFILLAATMILVASIYSVFLIKKNKRSERIVYMLLQILFLVHFVLFYACVVFFKDSCGVDFMSWSTVLRLHYIMSMLYKERMAISTQLRLAEVRT